MHISPYSFNDHHAKTRVKIECIYGMWKSKFSVLKCRNAYSPESHVQDHSSLQLSVESQS